MLESNLDLPPLGWDADCANGARLKSGFAFCSAEAVWCFCLAEPNLALPLPPPSSPVPSFLCSSFSCFSFSTLLLFSGRPFLCSSCSPGSSVGEGALDGHGVIDGKLRLDRPARPQPFKLKIIFQRSLRPCSGRALRSLARAVHIHQQMLRHQPRGGRHV